MTVEVVHSVDNLQTIQGSFKNKEACPRPASEKPWENLVFRELPAHPGGEIYTVFDEESDVQVENEQFRHQRSKTWKNLI